MTDFRPEYQTLKTKKNAVDTLHMAVTHM
jgi:hypothetical protein